MAIISARFLSIYRYSSAELINQAIGPLQSPIGPSATPAWRFQIPCSLPVFSSSFSHTHSLISPLSSPILMPSPLTTHSPLVEI